MVVLFLIFKGISILFSIVAVPTYIPTNNAQGFCFLHILCYLLSLSLSFFVFCFFVFFGCAGSSLLCMGFIQLWQVGVTLQLWCVGFSLWWLLLQGTGSRHMGFSSFCSQGLEPWFSSCGAPAQLPCGVWHFPGPGIEPVSQFSSVTHSCQTVCDPMDFSTPALAVHHQLPEFTQTHVH